jgi:acetyltransferase-like isoleucine patch superfamily enzyme
MSDIHVVNRGATIHDTVKFIGTGKIILGHGAQIRHFSIIEMCGGHFELGERSVLGFQSMVQCTGQINIGKGTLLGPQNVLLASYHPMSSDPEQQKRLINSTLTIGDNVWSGSHVTFNHGIVVGTNSVVGANSFVNKDVEENSIVVGSPAKHLRYKDE